MYCIRDALEKNSNYRKIGEKEDFFGKINAYYFGVWTLKLFHLTPKFCKSHYQTQILSKV